MAKWLPYKQFGSVNALDITFPNLVATLRFYYLFIV